MQGCSALKDAHFELSKGANTVRLYNVNPQNDHKKFMEKALSLGLYASRLRDL